MLALSWWWGGEESLLFSWVHLLSRLLSDRRPKSKLTTSHDQSRGLTQSTPVMSFVAINPLTLECRGRALRNKGSNAALLITDRHLRTLETWDQGELLPQGSGELPMTEEVLSAHPLPLFSSTGVFTMRAHGSG